MLFKTSSTRRSIKTQIYIKYANYPPYKQLKFVCMAGVLWHGETARACNKDPDWVPWHARARYQGSNQGYSAAGASCTVKWRISGASHVIFTPRVISLRRSYTFLRATATTFMWLSV